PGSVQGFQPYCAGSAALALENVEGHSQLGVRSLALRFAGLDGPNYVSAGTPTFIPPDALTMPGYTLIGSPTLYPGQTVRCGLSADPDNYGDVQVTVYLKYYGPGDQLVTREGSNTWLTPGDDGLLAWTIPDVGGQPIAEIGLTLQSDEANSGTLYLD